MSQCREFDPEFILTGISDLDLTLAHHTLLLTSTQRICHQSRPQRGPPGPHFQDLEMFPIYEGRLERRGVLIDGRQKRRTEPFPWDISHLIAAWIRWLSQDRRSTPYRCRRCGGSAQEQ